MARVLDYPMHFPLRIPIFTSKATRGARRGCAPRGCRGSWGRGYAEKNSEKVPRPPAHSNAAEQIDGNRPVGHSGAREKTWPHATCEEHWRVNTNWHGTSAQPWQLQSNLGANTPLTSAICFLEGCLFSAFRRVVCFCTFLAVRCFLLS